MGDRTFEEFMQVVKESLEQHAKRKGYNDSGANGDNKLYDFCVAITAEPGHSIGECVYKLTEYAAEPRDVLPIKIAAWVYLLWRRTPELRKRKGLPSECSALSSQALPCSSQS